MISQNKRFHNDVIFKRDSESGHLIKFTGGAKPFIKMNWFNIAEQAKFYETYQFDTLHISS